MALDTNTTNLISGGLNLAGSLYTANQATNAANTAAQMSQFKPVGITTRYGKSGFNYDPSTGQLIGAGYQVAPDVAAMRESLMGMSGSNLAQAQQAQAFQPQVNTAGQGLFNLGQQYLAQSPQAAAQDWMSKQQQLLAPGREQQLAQLTNQQFQQGRLGLGVGATQSAYQAGGNGLVNANPQMAAYYNAMAAQDAQLAAQANQAGQQQTQFGQGLLTGGMDVMRGGYGLQTSALQPFQAYQTQAQNLEKAAMDSLTQGSSLGSAAASSQQAAAQRYLQGQAAQQSALQGAITGLVDPVSKLIGGLAGSSPASAAASSTAFQPFGSNWWE